eukprot:6449760-Prymnesium_polylepis.1
MGQVRNLSSESLCPVDRAIRPRATRGGTSRWGSFVFWPAPPLPPLTPPLLSQMKPFIKNMAILWSSWMLECEATAKQHDRYGTLFEIETDKPTVLRAP